MIPTICDNVISFPYFNNSRNGATLMFENDKIEKAKETFPTPQFTEENAWVQI